MPIAVGSTIGPYEILAAFSPVGKAPVYRGRDPRNGQSVAIKLLPSDITPDPGDRETLLRQARAAVGKSFPHTCAVLAVGHDQGTDYLVMELLDGEPLVQQLRFGPLPVARAVRYGRQILEALESARARGLVDRIVDPENVMLTPAGVRLLDVSWALPGAPRIHISPERTAGHAGDERSDVYAFGMTMYEMLTGKKPFAGASGPTPSSPAHLRTLQPAIPHVLDRIVAKCLAKEPGRRWQSIADLRDSLAWLEDVPESPVRRSRSERHSRSERRSRRRYERFAWGGGLAVLALLLVWSLLTAGEPAPPEIVARATRTSIGLPPAERLENLLNPSIAISPDGTTVAYVARRNGQTGLWTRRFDQMEAVPLAGTEDAANPVFSPDGRSIAFAAKGRLLRIPVSGGTAIDLAPVADLWGISWSKPEEILYASGFTGGISRVPADGGPSSPVTTVERTRAEYGHHWPFAIPRTDVVLYARLPWRRGAMDDATIIAYSTSTGTEHILLEGGTQPRYVSTGHLVYSHNGTLYGVPLNLEELTVTEMPTPLVEGVLQTASGAAHYSVADDGRLVYLTGGVRGMQRQLVWVDRAGSVVPLPMAPQAYAHPRVSPDSRRVVARVVAPFCDVVMYDVSSDYIVRLPLDGDNHAPIWAERGERVLLQTVLPDAFVLRWLRPDGSGPSDVLLEGRSAPQAAVWFDREGTFVGTEGDEVVVMSLSRGPTRLTETARFAGSTPALSTDGRWLAYVAEAGGRREIFVKPFPSLDTSQQVTHDGGLDPVWASTGELFYRQGSRLMVMRTSSAAGFSADRSEALFDLRFDLQADGLRNFDVTSDGRRFLMIKSDESVSVPQAIVVDDWFSDLRRVQ